MGDYEYVQSYSTSPKRDSFTDFDQYEHKLKMFSAKEDVTKTAEAWKAWQKCFFQEKSALAEFKKLVDELYQEKK